MHMSRIIRVEATYDPEAGVWFTFSPDVHGLRIEAARIEELIERIPGALQDLLDGCEGDDDCAEVPVELVAHAQTKVRLAAA